MNTVLLNTINLDGGNIIIKKGSGGGGGVTIKNQSKSVDIVKNGTTEVVADAEFTGLGKVTINTNVASSGGGGVSYASVKDVNFRDYDGTILHSFTKDEFLALAEMPTLPTRQGLTCQEWNWDYEDAIEYVSEYGVLEVGATYITDDGNTRLYIRIADFGRMDVPLCFSQTLANGVTIDWGDGSETQTLNETGDKEITHTYSDKGDYCISLSVAEGCTLALGKVSAYHSIMGFLGSGTYAYSNMLQRVEIGENTTINSYAFQQCLSLASISIPKGFTSLSNNVFESCYSLLSIVIPKGVTTIYSNIFKSCTSLASVVIPNGVTSIFEGMLSGCSSLASVVIPQGVTSKGNSIFRECRSLASIIIPHGTTLIGEYEFYYCRSLASVVIPQSVTNIKANAFRSCYGMSYYDFRALTAVPTLVSGYAFTDIPSDCKIVVPDALYDEWVAATNWSLFASYIIKASEFNG